jgi:putative ABC transport system substrate-binding protein
VTAVGTLKQPGTDQVLRALEHAARASKVQLQYLEIRDATQIEGAFRQARQARADALIALSSAIFGAHRRTFADAAVKARLPVMYSVSEHVERGGLASYGVNRADLYRRAASYVDKILKGARPADLPVEQPTRFELIVNRKAAPHIGLTIPDPILQRADRLID